MGNTPSEIRKLAKASNDESEKMADDALNTMGAIAREKLKNFRLKVVSNSEMHEVPVDKLIYQNQMICCSVSEDDSNLVDTVSGLIGNIATGKFTDALVGGATAIVHALFGSMVGSEGEQSLYRIVVGPLGGIRRIDINLYMWAFTSETMIKISKNIMVVSVVVSSVDPAALDIPTLRVAIEQTCGDDIKMGKSLLHDVLLEWESEKKLAITGILPEPNPKPSAQPVNNTTSDAYMGTFDDDERPNPKKRRTCDVMKETLFCEIRKA